MGVLTMTTSTRSRTLAQAKDKQFAAMVKVGGLMIAQAHEGLFKTIHNRQKFDDRQYRLQRLFSQGCKCSVQHMQGRMEALHKMEEDPLLLVFCPHWAFYSDEMLDSDFYSGAAFAFRQIHTS